MREYVQTVSLSTSPPPNLLGVVRNGTEYRLLVQHATEGETHKTATPRTHQPHTHAVYHVVLFQEGVNACLWRGQAVPVRPGTLLLTAPDEPHLFSPLEAGKVVYSELTFSLESEAGDVLKLPFDALLGTYFDVPLTLPPTPLQLPAQECERFSAWLSEIVTCLLDHSALSAARAYARITSLFIRLAHIATPDAATTIPPIPPALHASHTYITRHYRDALTVDTLAHEACLSRSHFLRQFKRYFGISPLALQQQHRMEAAKTLLQSTELRCKEIAARVGYTDEYLFSRTFRQYAGCTATEFRKGKD